MNEHNDSASPSTSLEPQDLKCPNCGSSRTRVVLGCGDCGDCDYSWPLRGAAESPGPPSADTMPSSDGAQSRWIPVVERLPERFQTVIVYGTTDEPRATAGCEVARLDEDADWLTERTDGYNDPIYMVEVTHWVPLPEPPGTPKNGVTGEPEPSVAKAKDEKDELIEELERRLVKIATRIQGNLDTFSDLKATDYPRRHMGDWRGILGALKREVMESKPLLDRIKSSQGGK